jgi:hypothetical protein
MQAKPLISNIGTEKSEGGNNNSSIIEYRIDKCDLREGLIYIGALKSDL